MLKLLDKLQEFVYTEVTKFKEVITMKKIISLLLALLMTFSVVTVAFAEGTEETTAPTETTAPATDEGEEGEAVGETEFGDLQWIMDLPFWLLPG